MNEQKEDNIEKPISLDDGLMSSKEQVTSQKKESENVDLTVKLLDEKGN